ncbi:Coatomer protein [Mycena indigotica]|uniref:Coatomer protein n=1 Tax=Mycena indigotica TaxID=2126181 RepID=A0A8H6T3Q9_9AGAR|nr:Coatomer protein [Mycena indigotica]KAF7309701.1 Coatomer protein [Mycena indigotica]
MDGSTASFSFKAGYEHTSQPEDDPAGSSSKGPKRKRLAKACSACHKSKRRCDGKLPCSNCFYASKECLYVDGNSRASLYSDIGKQQDASKPTRNIVSRPKTDQSPNRKRVKQEDNRVILDHSLTRELTSLFFAHCHPVRAVFHKPTFAISLAHNRVPSFLVFAICALAAPLSRQPKFRSTGPPRFSGRPFAQEAISQMFDGSGQLICDLSLSTAQALCLLMAHHITSKSAAAPPDPRYRDLTLHVIQAMGVYNIEPAVASVDSSIERECARRVFWVMYAMELTCSICPGTQRPVSLSDSQLRLRLPVDETSFELAVHYPSPEYLHVRVQCLSELGNFVRILSLYSQAELILSRSDMDSSITMADLERQAEEWMTNLPEVLQFSESNLEIQRSMFETGSSTGAWCFCFMHACYIGLSLALRAGKNNIPSQSVQPHWATSRLNLIMQLLGEKARNSMLMGTIIGIQIKYCNRDDAQIRSWCSDYEEACGLRILDIVSPLAGGGGAPGARRSLEGLQLRNSWPSSSPGPSSGPERHERPGETLPSLKSSGLLDSWNPGNVALRPEKASPLNMPVGLQWLADETRTG